MANLPLVIEPSLAEEAVLLALRGSAKERAFRRERDPLYETADPERRAAAFDELHRRWFERLNLARPVQLALDGEPQIAPAVSSCLLRRVRGPQDQGVELLVKAPEPAGRIIRVTLHASAFNAPEPLLDFLRREMLHVSDMLDPHFGYSPVPPDGAGIPSQLLLGRYAVLWNVTIDGRLSRRGLSQSATRELRFHDFQRMFPMLTAPAVASAFERFHTDCAPVHGALIDFARNPRAADGCPPATPIAGAQGACPLCRLPTYALLPAPNSLSPGVLAAIGRDFPHWRPAFGICAQCADLYAARASVREPSRSPCS